MRLWAIGSWIVFLLSIGFGILTLMALTGALDPDPKRVPVQVSIRCPSVRTYSKLQVLSFMTALILTITFGTLTLK